MITRTLLIFILMITIRADSIAGKAFTITAVECEARSDSVYLSIIGHGDIDFKTYELSEPFRIIVQIDKGQLAVEPIKQSFPYPVTRIDLQHDFEKDRLVKLICELTEPVAYTAYGMDDRIIVAFAPSGQSHDTPISQTKSMPGWLNKKISVDFEDATIGSALSLMARQNGFDVVAPVLEDKEVTAHLADVSIGEALDAVLSVSGYVYFIIGDIVVVKPLEDEVPGELTTRIFELKYIDAGQIEKQIANMLTSRGKVQIVSSGQPSAGGTQSAFPAKIIAVTDLATIIPLVEEFIMKVDAKPKQVVIEVKLIETNLTENQQFGLDWQKSILGKITGAETGTGSMQDQNATLSAFSTIPIESGSFTYGTLNISEVSLLLEYLKSSGDSRLLSNPSVTTSDGKPAIIEVATTIPIQTINRFSEGAVVQDIVTFQYKDVGIMLQVTPLVNDDGYITMKCRPSIEEITGWVGPTDNQQPITSKRSIETDVVVRDGETLVIGGLMKKNVINTTQGIWFLSDIPIIGELFKHRSEKISNTELMILIKPTVLP